MTRRSLDTAVDQFGLDDGLTILDRLSGAPMTLSLRRIQKALQISESKRLCAEQPGTKAMKPLCFGAMLDCHNIPADKCASSVGTMPKFAILHTVEVA